MVDFLPYGRQSISDDDVEAVTRALRSGWLTQGGEVDAFEEEFAVKVGARHAVAVSNATAALHLAMKVAGVGPGDRVVTSPVTFLASANCAAYVGAVPDFVDIEEAGANLDAALLEAQWKPDTRAVVPVAYAGQACDLPAISRVARARDAIVIEDASHGTGGGFVHEGRPWKLGGHPWADMTVFSFHPVKTMTTGEGGMIVTDNSAWAAAARRLRSHGVEREEFEGLAHPDPVFAERGPWYYEMQQLGYNYRITDLQCALGRSQLARLDAFMARRRAIVARYNEDFSALPWLRTPVVRDAATAREISWHLYTVRIDFPALKTTRSEVMRRLRDLGVGTQVLYIPVHLQPWYRRTYGYPTGYCPKAEQFYTEALSLPLYPELGDGDVARVIAAVRSLA